MNRVIWQVFACILITGFTLYAYIQKLNQLTELRITIPLVEKELRKIHEENTRLEYAINQFENPVHLMQLQRNPEYSHLKVPSLDQVIVLPQGTIPEHEKRTP